MGNFLEKSPRSKAPSKPIGETFYFGEHLFRTQGFWENSYHGPQAFLHFKGGIFPGPIVVPPIFGDYF